MTSLRTPHQELTAEQRKIIYQDLWRVHEEDQREIERLAPYEQMYHQAQATLLLMRTIRMNSHVTPMDRLHSEALIDTYPAVLEGRQVEIENWKLAKAIGYTSKGKGDSCRATTRFFNGMREGDYLEYVSGGFDAKTNKREGGVVRANYQFLRQYETIDTRVTDQREKERQHSLERAKITVCEMCGGKNLYNEGVMHCRDCDHCTYPPIDQADTQEVPAAATNVAGHHVGLHPEDAPSTTAPTPAAPTQKPKKLRDYAPPPEYLDEPMEDFDPIQDFEPEPEPEYKSPAQRYKNMPKWCVPGTPEWKKQVRRNGLTETQAVREAWINGLRGEVNR